MKIYLRIFLLIFFSIPSFCLENKTYSISVCTTSSQESANICKEGILKTSKLEIFILENQNGTYSTYLGTFLTYNEAKEILNTSSTFIKNQKPFIKEIIKIEENKKVINEKIKDENTKDLEEILKIKETKILKQIKIELKESKEVQKLIENFRQEEENEIKISIDENKKNLEEILKQVEIELKESKETQGLAEKSKIKNEMEISPQKTNHLSSLDNPNNFESLIIKVDSYKNIMFLKGKNKDGKIIDIKSYSVSSAKTNIKKPQGVGSITSISLNPQWNPTNKTLKVFKEKGIDLPPVVPFGDKLNYMGAAKINLSHKVDGQEVYRIHGTLSENTIGTNESSGCIRMKNKEVVELATLLDKFSKIKSLNNISVVLE